MMADALINDRSQNLTPEEGKSIAVATLFPKFQGEPLIRVRANSIASTEVTILPMILAS
jgi:hypothetical protein